MKLQLKAIKHSNFASQETHCFEANLYVDGKKIGQVGNDGHGGEDHFHGEWEKFREVQAYFKTLPSELMAWKDKDGADVYMEQSIDIWCSEQVNTFLASRDLKSLLRKKVVGIEDGACYTWKPRKGIDVDKYSLFVKNSNPRVVILNSMDFDKALELYRSHG